MDQNLFVVKIGGGVTAFKVNLFISNFPQFLNFQNSKKNSTFKANNTLST